LPRTRAPEALENWPAGKRQESGGTTPMVVPETVNYRNLEHRELFLSGLRLAAGETT
jgi:hypothetical protein